MKKSKKVISLMLALVMVLSIMVVGASTFAVGAAGPKNLTVTQAGYWHYNLKWNAAANAKSYNLYMKRADQAKWMVNNVGAVTEQLLSFYPGVYFTQVETVYANGKSGGFSNVVTLNTLEKPNLNSVAYNSNASVTVGWTVSPPAKSGVTKYQIAKKKTGDKNYTYLYSNTNSINDKNVVCGTVYFYQVRPVVVSGKNTYYGPWSNSKSITTLYRPTITSMNYLNNKLLNINWNKIKGVSHYKVAFKRTTDKAWNYREVKTNYYNVPNPTKGATYVAQICPMNGKVAGQWSAAKTKNIGNLSKPVINSVQYEEIYNNTVEVSWSYDGPAEEFLFYYKRAQDPNWRCTSTENTSEFLYYMEAETTYYFQVRARIVDGQYSPYSDVKSFTTPEEPEIPDPETE